MKKTSFLAGIIFSIFTLAANAQDTTSTQPMTQDTTSASMQDTTWPDANATQAQPMTDSSMATTQEQKKYGNPTVDSILSKYTLLPMPSAITTEQIFPVIGQFQSNTNADQKITITLDDQNKGYAWIDGLSQGRIKAVLKKSPATYKIPAQTTEEGNEVREGTLIYDKDANVINIELGRPFNDQDPASVFAMNNTEDQGIASNEQENNESKRVTKTKNGKTKTKVKKEEAPWTFTGTKIQQVTAVNQQQPQQ
jgi:hypothetical protein